MADFSININAELVSNYTINTSAFFEIDMCNVPVTDELPIGLLQNTATLTPEYYMLLGYSNATPWKTLKIKDVIYSNPLDVYLSDTLVKIPEAGPDTVYDFDVTGQAVDIAIPDLTITYDNYTPTGSATIRFQLAIEDTDNVVGPYTRVTILISRQTCVEDNPRDILISSLSDIECSISATATVNVPSEQSRYVVVTANDIYGASSDTTAGETITVDTDYDLIIDASTVGSVTTYSSVIIKVYNNSGMTLLLDSYQITRNHEGNVC